MATKIRISDDLALPLDVAGQTQAILAIRGAGKTYLERKMFEEMFRAGIQVVAIDPTGVWHGVTSSADGKGPGLPILIMGGEHGHVPLESTAGEVVAEFIVDSGQSVVLDLSLMRKGESYRFMGAFLERLYHYKATHRENIHLLWDETDEFAPQRPGKDQLRVLGAAEDVVRRGRSRGLGMTMATQRPAVLNKNLLTQIEVLYAMRTIGPQDQDALRAWIDIHGDPEKRKEMMSSLATLKQGEAWIWSPAWLGIFKKIKCAPITTFDSSRTPKAGERTLRPRTQAKVDLNILSEKIKATVERSKQNDPKFLKSEVVKLQRELETAKKIKPLVSKPQPDLRSLKKRLIDEVSQTISSVVFSSTEGPKLLTNGAAFNTDGLVVARKKPVTTSKPEGIALPKGERSILTALAQHRNGCSKNALAILAGYAVGGGAFSNYVSALRTKGFITKNEPFMITEEGEEALGPYEELPGSGPALFNYWKGQLGKAEALILECVVSVAPKSISKEDIGLSTGYESSGGSFNNALSKLRTLGLIEGRNEISANQLLI